VQWVRKHPNGCVSTSRRAKMVRLVEYRYLIISTRAGWHMIKFKIHALECTRTSHFYVKNFKNFLGRGQDFPYPFPSGGGHPAGGLQLTSAGTDCTLCHIITIIWLLLGRFEINGNVAKYNRKSEMQDGGRQTGSTNTSQLAHGIVRSFDKRLILSYCENK